MSFGEPFQLLFRNLKLISNLEINIHPPNTKTESDNVDGQEEDDE